MDGMRITYPLDKNAVKAADRAFYERYPQMKDAHGKRIPIDPDNPAHQPYLAEWKQLYISAGGPAVCRTPTNAANDDLPPPSCQDDVVELVHVTGEQDQVYCLTQQQLDALIQAEQQLVRPIVKLQEAIQSGEDDLAQTKVEVWQELKELEVLPSMPLSRPNLLRQMEAELALARERYHRKKRRYDSLDAAIRRIDRELKMLLAPESRKFFERHRVDLLTASYELKDNLPFLKQEYEARKQLVKDEKARNLLLWKAIEAEVDFQVAEARPKEFTNEERIHKRQLAARLAEEANLASYVAQEEIDELVQIALRLRDIAEEMSSVRGSLVGSDVLEALLAVGEAVGGAIGRTTDKLSDREEERQARYRERRQALHLEKMSLQQRQQQLREDFVGRPALSESLYADQARPMTKLVEIKRSGAGGFRYVHRDALNDLRQQWARLNADQVKQALKPAGIKGAARRAGQELMRNTQLKLNLARWDSQEDHFFNLLNIELFKFDLDGNTDPRYENFSATAEAQMFRFAANAEVYASDMLRSAQDKTMHLGAKVQASYSILEAKAEAGLMIPSAQGWPLRLSYQGEDGNSKELELGYLRCQAKYSIQGFAGACVMLAAEVEVKTEPGEVVLSGKTQGEAFAGATLKNEATFLVEWSKPEGALAHDNQPENGTVTQFKELLKVVPSLAVSFGVGAAFDYGVGLKEGKLVLFLKGHLVLGPGGGGGVAAELNVEQIVELIKFVRLALERSDFRFQEWISEKAFEHISLIMKMAVVLGDPLNKVVLVVADTLGEKWKELEVQQNRVKELAQNVMKSNDLELCTPEAKAALLHILKEKFTWSTSAVGYKPSTWFDEDEEQAAACMRILDTVTSRRELVEILYRMRSPEGQSDDINAFMSRYWVLFNKLLFQSRQKRRAMALLDRLNWDHVPALTSKTVL